MNTAGWQKTKSLYLEALDVPASERKSFLASACGEDTGLLAEVRRLLCIDEEVGGFLETPQTPLSIEAGRTQLSSKRMLGDFELLEELGHGSMGIVYLARQRSLEREVAVKVMHPHLTFSTKQVAAFQLEATSAARLQHPGIVPVHSVGESGGIHFFAMDHIAGKSLQEVLHDLRDRGVLRFAGDAGFGKRRGRTSYAARVADVICQLADALQYSHDHNIIHRDIKPANILIDEHGRPHIADFGLAKDVGLETLYHTGRVSGTPYYMSPEQARTKRTPVDHRTDVYSLGVVLFEMLTLEKPFGGETCQEVFRSIEHGEPPSIRALNPRIAKDLCIVCLKAMEKDPDRRYQTAGDLARDLRRFLNHESVIARPPSPLERGRRFVMRNGLWLGAAGIAVTMFWAGGWVTHAWSQDDFEAEVASVKRLIEDDGVNLDEMYEAKVRVDSLRDSEHALTSQVQEGLAALEVQIMEYGRESISEAQEQIREGIERSALDLPGSNLVSLFDGLDNLELASRLLPDGELYPGETWDHFLPTLNVTASAVEATVKLLRLDPLTGLVLSVEELGATPLKGYKAQFGYFRVLVIGDDGSYGERTIVLREPTGVEDLHFDLSPTANVTQGMILVAPGPFQFGSGSVGRAPYPAREASVPAFWIDQYEVSNAEYKRFVDETGHVPPPIWCGEYDHAWNELPVVSVSYFDAVAYASWAGKRLPTALEWERASRGTDGRILPWTTDVSDDLSFAVMGAQSPATLPRDADALWKLWRDEALVHLRPVSSMIEGVGPEGLFHTLGNAGEWTETLFVHGVSEDKQIPQTGMRVSKGGNWLSRSYMRLDVHSSTPAEMIDRTIGFRCAKTKLK